MSEIHQSALVAFSSEQMFTLVNDVLAYPSYLPWCEKAECLAASPSTMRARLTVSKGRLRYTFTTDNTLDPPHRLELNLVDGPFRRLRGTWRFDDTPLGCRVSLDLEFEFASRLLGATLSPLFKAVTGSLVGSFKQRAEALYGRR
ncbi:MAG: type II toxin-antitoxin system RatA family toxin [Gammaproteobacteria bacterium]